MLQPEGPMSRGGQESVCTALNDHILDLGYYCIAVRRFPTYAPERDADLKSSHKWTRTPKILVSP